MANISALQTARYSYEPKLPAVLKNDLDKIVVEFGKPTESVADQAELKELFKNTYGKPEALVKEGSNPDVSKQIKVGVILSGGQAPGGHNVIAGLYDGIKKANKASSLYGFLGGPSGLIEADYVEIDDKLMDAYRNTGGFDIIGSGRTKIETPEQYAASAATAKKLGLDAIVIIGGDHGLVTPHVLQRVLRGEAEADQCQHQQSQHQEKPGAYDEPPALLMLFLLFCRHIWPSLYLSRPCTADRSSPPEKLLCLGAKKILILSAFFPCRWGRRDRILRRFGPNDQHMGTNIE